MVIKIHSPYTISQNIFVDGSNKSGTSAVASDCAFCIGENESVKYCSSSLLGCSPMARMIYSSYGWDDFSRNNFYNEFVLSMNLIDTEINTMVLMGHNGQSPEYLSDSFTKSSESHLKGLRNTRTDFQLPKKAKMGRTAFLVEV